MKAEFYFKLELKKDGQLLFYTNRIANRHSKILCTFTKTILIQLNEFKFFHLRDMP